MGKISEVLKKLPEDCAVVSCTDEKGRERILGITRNFSSLNLLEETARQIHGNASVEYAKDFSPKK